uniref:Kunitz-type trypsin inhibitor alpha chain n=1 Tax=Neltuma juliflora TaxID=3128859 RepID=ID5A_NELJU|nr:RecName: Full=Kunitz-type trypsin inhibitor alpha chain [Prosopis juliflora]AAB21123.1 Kunitz trypsin inhibitor alpha chain [Prosopsis juliflora, seeds, Peptide, 137 aa] [Prosopis juliflora]
QELLDVDGEILRNGGSYYILPAFRGKGGGLELAKTEGETCPLTVVQARSETDRGLPASIWSPPRIAIIRPGFSLNIEFRPRNPSACHRESSLQWKVEEESQQVKIAVKEDARGFGPFRIRPHRDDYKLVYCDEGQKR